MKLFDIAERIETVMWDAKKMFAEPRLVLARSRYHMMGVPTRDVHAAVRHLAHHRLVRRTSSSSAATARSSARPPTTSGPTTSTFVPIDQRN